jgi:hypothetical protein
MSKTRHFSKRNDDGDWKLELYPVEGNAFAKWAFQQYKSTPLGWVEMGEQHFYYSQKLALTAIHRLGYQKAV